MSRAFIAPLPAADVPDPDLPGDAVADRREPAPVSTDASPIWRLRLLIGVLLLAAVAFRQSGGLVVPDTKLDLTANPGRFLARALHMWDPSGALGQLQNQAYGYLFPVGPFHLALTSVGIPDWIVQRLWWTTILAVGFLGVWRLSGALGLGDPWARYVAALLYALGPRFLSEIAVTSVELWPMAVAPWVLLPLVTPGKRTWRWRILWSALAFALTGGVNAVASGAALVIPTLWFATRAQGREAAKRFAMWLAAVIAVALWWFIPLILLGRYSPPFLDWIENAPVTTAFASPFEALRGTTPWLNYLSGAAGPAWPAGWQFVTLPALVVATTLLAGLGLVGLRLAPREHRTFLGLTVLVGLVLVTMGHTGVASSLMAEPVQHLLDGPLAPLRNTHKFELVVRLPLSLGLAVSVTRVVRLMRGVGLASWLVPVAAISAVGLLAAPAITASLARPEGYTAIPRYWRDAALWLDEQAQPGPVLVVPAAGFADFFWGSTKDDPLQALSTRGFAVRDAVPLGSAGATRWLDSVERSLQSGTGGGRLRASLESAGIRHVVVRNDLRADSVDSAGGQSLRLHEALELGGLKRVATFGPPVGSPPGTPLESSVDTVDQRTRLPYPSVEVFAVSNPHDAAVVDGTGLVMVDGGAEDVADALVAVPGASAAIVGSDVSDLPESLKKSATSVTTDGNQDREVFFGRATNNSSSVLFPGDNRRTGRETDDYVADGLAPQTVRRTFGDLSRISASSSASDANSSLRLGPGYGPQAAVDGDPSTAWVSGEYGSSVGQWIQLNFATASEVSGLTISLEKEPRLTSTPSEVRIETETGSTTARLLAGSGPQPVKVPDGRTKKLKVTVTETVEGDRANGVGIAELAIPRLALGTRLAVPSGSSSTDVVVLRRANDGRRECALVVDRPLCTGSSGRQAEAEGGLRRSLRLPGELVASMSGEVVAKPGEGVDRLLVGLTSVQVQATSRSVREPEGRPATAMDGRLATGWIAAPNDRDPTLTIRLPHTVTTDRLQLQRDAFLAASMPSRVEVTLDDAQPMDLKVDKEGYLRWPRQSIRTLKMRFTQIDALRSTDSASGFVQNLPVGVSEVLIPGVDPRGPLRSSSKTGATCGFGPSLTVGAQTFATAVSGTVEAVLQGQPLRWDICGDEQVTLLPGEVTVDALATAEFTPTSLVLRTVNSMRSDSAGDEISRRAASTNVPLIRTTPARMAAHVPASARPGLLVVSQNYSEGWVAHDAEGRLLAPVRINGWQQGWVLEAGPTRAVSVEFAPDSTYRAALVAGGLLILAMIGALLSPTRGEGRPPLLGASVPAWVINAVVVLGLFIIAGPLGVLAAMSGLAIIALLPSSKVQGGIVAGAAAGSAVIVAVAAPWPEALLAVDASLVQLLALLAVAVAVLADSPNGAAMVGRLRSLRRPHRIMGRSTQ